ncbi:vWA domain-containing protein [Eubacterium ventriosum]|uniref:vWA domain-containing protein n=1 Tax=Eubacterium ventriosum TaxID=39496 RepID=UPI0021089A0C|nr:VWA-like domain-containing protein [Eubacterium ventriosum]MCQ5339482.1 VWA-like domain-containing protein [Eubacterium ventriosum]
MELSSNKIKEYTKRLMLSKMRILCNNGFYGLLLMHMKYGLDAECGTAYTDGKVIRFDPKFLDELNDDELDFIMMHEILHVALKHCFRGRELEKELYNIACDIVVNSNILLSNNMDTRTITLRSDGEAMHLAPNGKEGYEYTAEEVYNMLQKNLGMNNAKLQSNGKTKNTTNIIDNHTKWQQIEKNKELEELWISRLDEVSKTIEIRDSIINRETMPAFAQRRLKELKNAQTDWREILIDFLQEEVVDYSFMPPDRRFDDCSFFLPDFNDKDIKPENILFMIDTSASMKDDMVTAAYSEVKGAIEQFNGKLIGMLGFFDAVVIEPVPFENEEEFEMIKAIGGGGTNFQIIFNYVKEYMTDNLPVSIIILTDGYAPFPKESEAMGIPVIWLLNNEKVNPPWGKVARIKCLEDN